MSERILLIRLFMFVSQWSFIIIIIIIVIIIIVIIDMS